MEKIETEKFYLWKLDKEEQEKAKKFFNPILEVDIEKEILLETRIYPISKVLEYKILAKQNKETKKISAVVIKQHLCGKKEIIFNGQFTEKDYSETIKGFDELVERKTNIKPVIISSKEFEQATEMVLKG